MQDGGSGEGAVEKTCDTGHGFGNEGIALWQLRSRGVQDV